jgi:glycosyltransferase involved in cell wall biosynthesis
MLLTVGIPAYNAMPYLPATMNSLLEQTSTDFRILVINDGSTDGTLEYLKSIRDHRLRIISQENQGLTGTLNRMLEEAETPWLVRQDADDIAFPGRLETIAKYVRLYPDTGMFYSRAVHLQNGRSFGALRTTEADPQTLREITKSGYLLSICHPSVTLNVKKTLAIGAYRFNLHVEEYDFYWRMALEHEIRFIPKVLLGYRMNVGSVSNRNVADQAANILFVQYLLLSQIWNKRPHAYGEVIPKLRPFLDQGYLKFRQYMRAAMAQVGQKRYGLATRAALAGFAASPGAFLNRLLFSTGQGGTVRLGSPPELFLRHESALWS